MKLPAHSLRPNGGTQKASRPLSKLVTLSTRSLRAIRWALPFCAVLTGGAALAKQDYAAGALLREAARHQEQGDLEASWRAWMAFMAHPGRNQPDLKSFAACFFLHGCAEIGTLGALLGKSREEAAALDSFCPQWRDFRADIQANYKPEEATELLGHLDFIRDRAVDGSCPDWRAHQLALLHDQPAPRPAPPPQIVPIEFRRYSTGGVWPVVRASFDGREVWMLPDTGTTVSTTSAEPEDSPLAERLTATPRLAIVTTRTGNGPISEDAHRAASLQLGRTELRQVTVHVSRRRINPEIGPILGMNVLLRYAAVCFHWPKMELHLGGLGPCGAGVELANARLTGGLQTMLQLPMPDGSTLDALLDTGSVDTSCSTIFAERNGGGLEFRFGEHPSFTAECQPPTPLTPGATPLAPLPGQAQARIGMDTLLRFEAFGWRLKPFKAYLTLRKPASQEAGPLSPNASATLDDGNATHHLPETGFSRVSPFPRRHGKPVAGLDA